MIQVVPCACHVQPSGADGPVVCHHTTIECNIIGLAKVARARGPRRQLNTDYERLLTDLEISLVSSIQ